MAVTDLLAKIPFPPSGQDDDANEPPDADEVIDAIEAPDDEAPDHEATDADESTQFEGDGAPRTFAIELPVEIDVAAARPSEPATAESEADAPAEPPTDDVAEETWRVAALATVLRYVHPLPSYAIALIGGLALTSLALAVALVLALSSDPEPVVQAEPVAVVGADPAEPTAPAPNPAPSATPASFPADPLPIPVDLITRLEAASGEPLDVELTRLLDAIQHGFGSQSARLEPTLRSYVYRMTSRFEWNPDSFRVAVTAPSADLAEARAALLTSLFEEAVATGRLQIGTGTGPHALTLVSAPSDA